MKETCLKLRISCHSSRAPVKDKYIGIIKKHLVDFDEKFRKVSLIKTAATREEAAKERALKFVKSKTYNTVTDVNNARNELAELLPELGHNIRAGDRSK